MGPHAMKKRALKSGRKKRQSKSNADPKRHYFYSCHTQRFDLPCPPSLPWSTRPISSLSVSAAIIAKADSRTDTSVEASSGV